MARLVASAPARGLLPREAGAARLSELAPGAITGIAPFRGRERAVSDALEAAFGAPLPAACRVAGTGGARVFWSGLGEALAIGPFADPDGAVARAGAAVTDQSDAHGALAIEGGAARDALARLTPLDLRPGAFRIGHAARSLLGHVPCLFARTGESRYEMLVPRSMTATAVHDLARAMEGVAARAGAP